MDIRISIGIVHHPKRSDLLQPLVDSLSHFGVPVDVFTDSDSRGVWWNTARAWRAIPEGTTHRILLQDDTLPCRDFPDAARAALAHKPNSHVSFFGNTKKMLDALARGKHWVAHRASWGVAPCLPVHTILPFLAWADNPSNWPSDAVGRMPDGSLLVHDDYLLKVFLKRNGISSYLTVPSLVEHVGRERSLLGHNRSVGTQLLSAIFIGQNMDGSAIDWSRT